MTGITVKQIKDLREKTGSGVMDCRRALTEAKGDEKKAIVWLKKKGLARAAKRADREAKSGLVEAYSHAEGQVVAVVELACETDFVAKTSEFRVLAHELAMQVAAMKPADVDALLKQSYIRDEQLKVGDLLAEAIGKIGENILVRRIARFELGEGSK
jgi:elongation factor Ts